MKLVYNKVGGLESSWLCVKSFIDSPYFSCIYKEELFSLVEKLSRNGKSTGLISPPRLSCILKPVGAAMILPLKKPRS